MTTSPLCPPLVCYWKPWPKDDSVQIERIFDDSRGGNPAAQNVLLGGQVIAGSDPLHVANEAAKMKGKKSLPKSNFFQIERVFDDSRRGDSHAQDVLLSGQVIGLRYSINVG